MKPRKLFNNPIYGLITLSNNLILNLLDHRYMQRLRHIRQLGVADYVYPGALHTRFHHAIGSLFLMGKALDTLRQKGVEISEAEYDATQIAILLHDIGHGPLSHTLETAILKDVKHETLSLLFMQALNQDFSGELNLAIEIFRGVYHRKFFHQLVTGQTDIDRLDYLQRDSYFTSVPEGNFGVNRLISLMNVVDDSIAIDEKGIFCVESFLYARRYMYWQVYLHKTVIGCESMLVNIFKRAQYLLAAGEKLACSDALKIFLLKKYTVEDFSKQKSLLETFSNLDDHDVWGAVKLWQSNQDTILSGLCTRLIQRQLFQVRFSETPIKKKEVEKLKYALHASFGISLQDTAYLFGRGSISNEPYVESGKPILAFSNSGKNKSVYDISSQPMIKSIIKIVRKNFLCWPKSIKI